MALTPGTRLGPYEVTAQIGAGGMGEVYRATDTNLKRQVAIKVLPESLAADPERLARFQREAEVLAALNHPNIAHIHGLERSNGTTALVMELVEGPTLADRIAQGAIPMDEALPIAKQIAEGLEAAHEQGIIHRDLKPTNIKVRDDGTVKVLDFGLAKAVEPTSTAPPGATTSPTITTPAMTAAGMILGTAAYMSPEQAKGRVADRRADIWAFGCVLYEMLTSRRACGGEDVSETLAAVLTREPDWTALPSQTPGAIRQLLRRCLERDVRHRLQSIGEARIVLEDPAPLTSEAATRRPARHVAFKVAAGVAVGLILFAAGWLLRPAGPAEQPVRLLDLALGSADSALGHLAHISPDGSGVVIYSGVGKLRVRRLDRLDTIDLPVTDDARYPTWSPDSRQIAYVARDRAWKVSLDGGTPIDLGAVPPDLVGSGGSAWTSDGQIVFAGSDTVGLWALPATGGAGRDLLPLDRGAESDFHEIAALPDGRGLIFTVHARGGVADTIAVFAGGTRRTLFVLPGESLRDPVYSPTGHVLYTRETTSPGVWAIRFDLDRLETTGTPFLVVPEATSPSIAHDGTLSFVRADDAPVELVRVSRTGIVEPVAALAGTRTSMLSTRTTLAGVVCCAVSLSPDGTRVALVLGSSPGQLSVYDLERGSLSTIANGTFPVRPTWTTDGDVLVYASSREARAWNLWARRADGSGEEQRYATSEEVQWPAALSPDGTTLVYSEGSGPTGNFFKVPMSNLAQPEPLFGIRISGMGASFSPDGQYLSFASSSSVSANSEIYVRPFPEGDRNVQVSTGGGTMPVWTKSGEIFYTAGSAVVSARIDTRGGALAVSKPVVLFPVTAENRLLPPFDVTPDGTTFYMLRSGGGQQISVVLNWPRELARIEASAAAPPQ